MRFKYFILAAFFTLCGNVAQAAPFAFIPNNDDKNVSVIDIATQSEVAKVSVGDSPRGVAITPNGKFVYITNSGGTSVSVIDNTKPTPEKLANDIEVGQNPIGISITPDGKYVYVANLLSNTISVIDTATQTKKLDIAMPTDVAGPTGITITSNGKYVYVSAIISKHLVEIETDSVLAHINDAKNPLKTRIVRSFTGSPAGVVLSSPAKLNDPTIAYIAVFEDGNPDEYNMKIVSFDPQNPTKITEYGFGVVKNSSDLSLPSFNISLHPNQKTLYVPDPNHNQIFAINVDGQFSSSPIPVGKGPISVGVSPDGKLAYVVNALEAVDKGNNVKVGTLSVVNLETNKIVKTVELGSSPTAFGNFTIPAGAAPMINPPPPSAGDGGCALNPAQKMTNFYAAIALWFVVFGFLGWKRSRYYKNI